MMAECIHREIKAIFVQPAVNSELCGETLHVLTSLTVPVVNSLPVF